MKFFPTSPLELARPSGNAHSRTAAEAAAFRWHGAASTTTLASMRCSRRSASRYSTPVTRFFAAIVVHAMNERLADDARTELLGFRQIGVGGGRLRFGRATRPAPAAGDARGPAVPLHRVDGDGRREWMRTELRRSTRQHLRMPVHAVRRHRQRVGFRREWPALARHAELPFDLLIVRPQIVVTDRPIRTHAFGGERAEILAMESRHHAEPGQSAAAHARSRFRNHEVRADEVARLGPHDFARVCLRVLQSRLPAEPRPGFQYGNCQPVRRHPQRHQRTGRPCANNEHIKPARGVAEKESRIIRTRYPNPESRTRT